jgi:hypothetical protein
VASWLRCCGVSLLCQTTKVVRCNPFSPVSPPGTSSCLVSRQKRTTTTYVWHLAVASGGSELHSSRHSLAHCLRRDVSVQCWGAASAPTCSASLPARSHKQTAGVSQSIQRGARVNMTKGGRQARGRNGSCLCGVKAAHYGATQQTIVGGPFRSNKEDSFAWEWMLSSYCKIWPKKSVCQSPEMKPRM